MDAGEDRRAGPFAHRRQGAGGRLLGLSEAVSFSAVSLSFDGVRAVVDLSFGVPSGGVTVLLGPNGAGKTTAVRLTTGALTAERGSIRVLGRDPSREGTEVRRRCGVIPPRPAFYEQLTGRENLGFAARVFGAPPEAGLEAARRFGIENALDREVAGYSTGMRARLALARAILHDPALLLLDEPTAGLDPESSKTVLGIIAELSGRGRTVLMCTHLLHEAEGIADRVVLLAAGSVRASGSPAELAGRHLSGTVVVIDAENREALGNLERLRGVRAVRRDGGPPRVTIDGPERLPDLVADLVREGARITRVETVQPSLEELYFEMQRTCGAGR